MLNANKKQYDRNDNMEENLELLQALEEISRLSFEIQIIYSRLTLLEVSKDITENYEQEKKLLLDSLALLLEEEKKPINHLKMTSIKLNMFKNY